MLHATSPGDSLWTQAAVSMSSVTEFLWFYILLVKIWRFFDDIWHFFIFVAFWLLCIDVFFLGVLLTFMLFVKFSINSNYLLLSLTMFSKHMKFIDFHWFLQGLWNSVDSYWVLKNFACFLWLLLTFRMFGQTLTLFESLLTFAENSWNWLVVLDFQKFFGVCRFYFSSFFVNFYWNLVSFIDYRKTFMDFLIFHWITFSSARSQHMSPFFGMDASRPRKPINVLPTTNWYSGSTNLYYVVHTRAQQHIVVLCM